MGYFPNTLPNPFTPIQKQINNAANGLSNVAKQIISAEQQLGRQAIDGQNLVLNQAYKAIGSPRVAIDPCNVVIRSGLGNYTFRNSACSIKPTNKQVTQPDPRILSDLPSSSCYIAIILARTIYTYTPGSYQQEGGSSVYVPGIQSIQPGIDSIAFAGETTYPNLPFANANTQYTPDHSVFGGTLGTTGYGYEFTQPLPPSVVAAYPGIIGIACQGVLLQKYGILGESGLAEWEIYANDPTWGIIYVFPGSTCFLPNEITPPPPPREKKKMCCCDDNSNNSPASNSNLLKLILQRIGDFPASVSDNFTSAKPNQITLVSLGEMMLWLAQQMDGLAGQYPVSMTIKADPTVKDSKDQQISLPNQAETLAEILGLLITTKRDTHANLIATIAAMTEAGLAKKLASTTLDVALANAEFLGYKLTQKTQNISLQYTPNGKDMATTLTPTTISNITYSNDDKTDLQDDLKKILEMCARWNAQNWRQIGSNAAQSLYSNFIGNNSSVDAATQATRQQTFNQFLSEAEIGFTDVSGVTDSVDPWGEPYANRPILREIGNSNGNYNADGTPKVSDAAPSAIPAPSTNASSPAGGSSSTSV
jgi:hypothetical protein